MKDNIISLDDKRWEKEFDKDLQEAFEEVVAVLHNHLPAEVGSVVGKAIAIALKDVGDKILESLENLEEPPKLS
jgi:predicted Zn-dependent protease with MMP-like domain|tara:strand:+ start:151 stop:372 length:222 start_codon:yes stop_codon:yes gene_type:complete